MAETVVTTDLMPGSVTYIHLGITANVNIATDTIQVSNDQVTWTAGTYFVHPTNGPGVRLLVTLVAGKIPFYSKITDSPEVPIVKHGYLQVSAS